LIQVTFLQVRHNYNRFWTCAITKLVHRWLTRVTWETANVNIVCSTI